MSMPNPQNWVRHTSNPCIPNTYAWQPWAYACGADPGGTNLWFTAWDGRRTRIGHAATDNQLDFMVTTPNPLVVDGYSPAFAKEDAVDPTVYHLYYTVDGASGHASIHHATSADGYTDWTPQGAVLQRGSAGSWDAHSVGWCSVMYVSDLTNYFMMWYGGSADGRTWKIGYAESSDGTTWTKNANPVLEPAAGPAWDDGFVNKPTVVLISGTYWMWYHGGSNNSLLSIGCASSPDAQAWTKVENNPVFTKSVAGQFDSKMVLSPTCWYNYSQERVYMYYTGWNGARRQTGAAYLDGVN